MTLWQAVVLGLVQGLTEFLPVSSDGHLVLTGALLGVSTPGVFVEVALHVATLGAVLIVFGPRLWVVFVSALRGDRLALRYVALLLLASIPAAFVGLVLKSLVERTFDSLWFAGAGFLATGFALWSTRNRSNVASDRVAPAPAPAFAIGAGQALAILPGVSRSGMTVSIGLWAGLSPQAAAEFSFLLAVPAIGGAAVLEIPHLSTDLHTVGVLPLAVACLVALGSGIWAIRWLLVMLRRGRLHAFAPYCWFIGALTLAYALWRA
ncbi:MAG: undecaprenyl-diphosphate phosphatase [Gemmatimonadales bacterium]|nr:undecaprenyl-diphosphate phosphatase [Gemmatimonadales bacterium]